MSVELEAEIAQLKERLAKLERFVGFNPEALRERERQWAWQDSFRGLSADERSARNEGWWEPPFASG